MKIGQFIKSLIHKALNILGYEIQRYYPPSNALYEPFHPYRYTPWNKNDKFIETFQKIQTHTLVDKFRCYELWSLVEQSKKSEGSLIEIGVWKGGTGALIARKARICGINDPVYLCDTFTGVVKASEKDTAYKGGEHSDANRQIVDNLLGSFDLNNICILEGIFPEQTSHLVAGQKFRFCHIDVDVYQSAKDIVGWIWDKMSIGGIVVYDDFGFRGTDGITKYVNEQMLEPDRIVIYNWNGHAVVIKIK